jgi:hypothetical protein
LTTTVEKTGPHTKIYGRHSADKQNESVLAAYKRSNNDAYDDYDDDKKSDRQNSNNQSHSLSDANDNDYDTESGSTKSRSHSRSNSNSKNSRSGSNSRQNNRTNDSRDGRIRISFGGRTKADVNISDDDNSRYEPEDADMGDRLPVNRHSSNNSTFSSKSNSNKTIGFQHIPKRSLRVIREAYNIEDGVSAVSKFLE